MAHDVYLTTAEAADYLRLKERKLYELVAEGAIPCTKVTGKWLFPRVALDQWLASGLVLPPGVAPAAAPPVIAGSHDLLLEWAARESGCGLALLNEGSERGLERLAAGEAQIASIHLHGGATADRSANAAAVEAIPGLYDAVVIAFARREQGLIFPFVNPLGLQSLPDAVAKGARFAVRQKGAGAQRLLEVLLSDLGADVGRLSTAGPPAPTGTELGHVVRSGRADCGIAPRAVADIHGLAFIPLMWEAFDLVMHRRTYFEPGPQRLFERMRTAEFQDRAREFGGYAVDGAGAVVLNR